MAISGLAEFIELLGQAPVAPWTVSPTTTLAGRPYDLWRTNRPVGAVPTLPVACDVSLLGAMVDLPPSVGRLSLLGTRTNGLNPGNYLLVDRLSHAGGLSGTVVGPQVGAGPNLPTAPLPRYTDGVGVMMGLSIYTAVGATASSVEVSYTNTVPTAGRTSPETRMGASGFREANRMIQIPWQDGDLGVTSVESVSLTGTTGTVGVFGVTLYKPLYSICVESTSGVEANGFVYGGNFGGIPEVLDDACLSLIAVSGGTSAMASGALILGDT